MIASGQDPRQVAQELAEREVLPIVPVKRSGLPTPLVVGLLAILAMGLFLFLDGRRRAAQQVEQSGTSQSFQTPTPPPPLSIPRVEIPEDPPIDEAGDFVEPAPLPPPPSPPPSRAYAPAPPAPPIPNMGPVGPNPSPAEPPLGRDGATALVLDFTNGPGVAMGAPTSGAANAEAAASDEGAIRATLIRNRASIIPQGTMIAATLETPLNSDRPGMARAIVSRDAKSFDGSRTLIPRGSRLIGEFKADANPNQRRVLVTWTRLIRPDGVAIRIGSPAADALGGAGIPGRVNTHFIDRFMSAVLQSALTVGVNLASRNLVNEGGVYIGLPNTAGQLGQQSLSSSNRATTIKVKQGAEILIFVARDLDFGGTPAVQ